MIRNVLLDWSGTLADDLGSVLEATNKIFAEYGRDPLDLEQFRSHFRLPFSEFYAELLPEATLEGLEELYERFFHGMNDRIDLLPGAREFLDFCRETGRRTFLLSSIKTSHFTIQAERNGVASYFEVAYTEVMDKRSKIREILKTHQLDPSETMFVGDMVHDIETAKHGGVLDVAVLSGFDRLEKLAAAHPTIIARDIGGVQRLL
jgi:phosphoglycolate phosphatase-like HAD superfamily hydrolase